MSQKCFQHKTMLENTTKKINKISKETQDTTEKEKDAEIKQR